MDSDLVNIEVNHGGCFVKRRRLRYMNGKVDMLENVDLDVFGWFDLEQVIVDLGYGGRHQVYFRRPRESLDDGLMTLCDDSGFRNLINICHGESFVSIYVEHFVEDAVVAEDPLAITYGDLGSADVEKDVGVSIEKEVGETTQIVDDIGIDNNVGGSSHVVDAAVMENTVGGSTTFLDGVNDLTAAMDENEATIDHNNVMNETQVQTDEILDGETLSEWVTRISQTHSSFNNNHGEEMVNEDDMPRDLNYNERHGTNEEGEEWNPFENVNHSDSEISMFGDPDEDNFDDGDTYTNPEIVKLFDNSNDPGGGKKRRRKKLVCRRHVRNLGNADEEELDAEGEGADEMAAAAASAQNVAADQMAEDCAGPSQQQPVEERAADASAPSQQAAAADASAPSQQAAAVDANEKQKKNIKRKKVGHKEPVTAEVNIADKNQGLHTAI